MKIKLSLTIDALDYLTQCVSSDLERSESVKHIDEKIDVYRNLKATKEKYEPPKNYFVHEQ